MLNVIAKEVPSSKCESKYHHSKTSRAARRTHAVFPGFDLSAIYSQTKVILVAIRLAYKFLITHLIVSSPKVGRQKEH